MTVNVVALDRGGYSAHGGAWWDGRDKMVRLEVFDEDDAVAVVVQYSDTPTEVAYTEDGISSSTPAISGNAVTILFQGINPSGLYKLTTYFASGASKTLWFQAHHQQPQADGAVTADIDYGEI